MIVKVSLTVHATVDRTRFKSIDDMIEHVSQIGDIDTIQITPVALVPRAQPESGANNAGSVEAVSHQAPPAAGDTGTDGPAVVESATEPARTVTITDIRTKASQIMAADPSSKAKIAALLREFGVDNMTSLGEKQDILPAFFAKLNALSASN